MVPKNDYKTLIESGAPCSQTVHNSLMCREQGVGEEEDEETDIESTGKEVEVFELF